MSDPNSKILTTMLLGMVAMVLPFAIFVPIGLYLDNRFGTKPWIFIAALAVSAVMAMGVSVLKAQRLIRKMNVTEEKPAILDNKK